MEIVRISEAFCFSFAITIAGWAQQVVRGDSSRPRAIQWHKILQLSRTLYVTSYNKIYSIKRHFPTI